MPRRGEWSRRAFVSCALKGHNILWHLWVAVQFPQLEPLMGELPGEHCCLHGSVRAGNGAARKQKSQLEQFYCQPVWAASPASGQSSTHGKAAVTRAVLSPGECCQSPAVVSHPQWCRCPAVAPARAQQCHPPGVCLQAAVAAAGAKEGELQVSARAGEASVLSMGSECAAMLLVQLGWMCFPAALPQPKALLQIYAQLVLQIRILQCPTLMLHVVEMTNMCSVIRLTAFYARSNAGSSGFRGCGSCWACAAWQSSQLMQQQSGPCPSPSYCCALSWLSFDRLSKQDLY